MSGNCLHPTLVCVLIYFSCGVKQDSSGRVKILFYCNTCLLSFIVITIIWHGCFFLTFQWIFLYYSVVLFFFFFSQKTAIHSQYESHFGREATQLCMIGCTAVLSHSHRHAFDLSPASKVLSKHCKESLSKCSLLAHFSCTETSYSSDRSSKYLSFGGRLEWPAK